MNLISKIGLVLLSLVMAIPYAIICWVVVPMFYVIMSVVCLIMGIATRQWEDLRDEFPPPLMLWVAFRSPFRLVGDTVVEVYTGTRPEHEK